MNTEWPAFKDMAVSILIEGPGHLTKLPIAPTMKHLFHNGDCYFRMTNSRFPLEDGTWAGGYLWSKWEPK